MKPHIPNKNIFFCLTDAEVGKKTNNAALLTKFKLAVINTLNTYHRDLQKVPLEEIINLFNYCEKICQLTKPKTPPSTPEGLKSFIEIINSDYSIYRKLQFALIALLIEAQPKSTHFIISSTLSGCSALIEYFYSCQSRGEGGFIGTLCYKTSQDLITALTGVSMAFQGRDLDVAQQWIDKVISALDTLNLIPKESTLREGAIDILLFLCIHDIIDSDWDPIEVPFLSHSAKINNNNTHITFLLSKLTLFEPISNNIDDKATDIKTVIENLENQASAGNVFAARLLSMAHNPGSYFFYRYYHPGSKATAEAKAKAVAENRAISDHFKFLAVYYGGPNTDDVQSLINHLEPEHARRSLQAALDNLNKNFVELIVSAVDKSTAPLGTLKLEEKSPASESSSSCPLN